MIYAVLSVLALALLGLDQWVKAWTVATFAAPVPPMMYSTGDPAVEFMPGFVELTRIHNYGAAWSSFSGQRWLLPGVTFCIVIAVLVLLAKGVVRHPVGLTACFLVLSGGIGNIIDRVRFGYVVDMFHFEFWPSYPVFNVADICVVTGAILGAIYYMWLYDRYDNKKLLAAKAAEAAETAGETGGEETDGTCDAPTE